MWNVGSEQPWTCVRGRNTPAGERLHHTHSQYDGMSHHGGCDEMGKTVGRLLNPAQKTVCGQGRKSPNAQVKSNPPAHEQHARFSFRHGPRTFVLEETWASCGCTSRPVGTLPNACSRLGLLGASWIPTSPVHGHPAQNARPEEYRAPTHHRNYHA